MDNTTLPTRDDVKALLKSAKSRDDLYTVAMCKLALSFDNPAAWRYCAEQCKS